MRRFLIFGAVMIMQGVAIVPVRALAQGNAGRSAVGYGAYGYGSYEGRNSDTSSNYVPPTVNQGEAYPSGQYGYPRQQTYPAQSYPTQPSLAQPHPAQPAPSQATSPDAVCTGGRFFDHMTKSCESP